MCERKVFDMANTTAVYARIDSGLKENAEQILSTLGITPSCAIQMLYSQIVLQRGLPFEARLPKPNKPLDVSRMTREELSAELEKGYEDIKAGRVIPANEAFARIREDYGL